MQRMRHRPREPGGGPAAGDPRPRTLPRGRPDPGRPRIRELEGRGAVGTAATAVIGIDVSKDTLDACLLTPDGKARLVPPLLTPAARKSVARVIKLLGKEADAMPAAADALIAATPALAADAGLLASIPGVGTQTASTVLAERPALDRVPSAQAAAAYCGLSPREFKSGSSVRGRTGLSK